MFSTDHRNRVKEWLLAYARDDPRIVAGAEVGAGALVEAPDRWSDIDLTFGVRDGVALTEPLQDWTDDLATEQAAVRLFDLPFLSTMYRVFLLPGNLQVDLSFTPEAEFGPLGPKFRLLFGQVVARERIKPPNPREVFGLAVHHALRARLCIERQRYWQAEYWIHALRDHALELACLHHHVEGAHGRGFDELPPDTRGAAVTALACTVDRDELLRALGAAVRILIAQARAGSGHPDDVPRLVARLEPQLLELLKPSLSG
jgi:hypothetical protein